MTTQQKIHNIHSIVITKIALLKIFNYSITPELKLLSKSTKFLIKNHYKQTQ